MLKRFKIYAKEEKLFSTDSKILAAVSGGVDSVALVHLLKLLEVDFCIAHCNFKLRGKASDEDEKFVENLAKKLKVNFHSTSFETEKYAAEKGISIQMAARELRYKWFENLRKKTKSDCIATAHHKNDNVETVILNLIRGTGHKGLVGISPKKNKIIRPLLAFLKDEILAFAEKEKINWREDISNSEDKYKRNLLRNKIIPLLEELNPNFINTFSENIERFNIENSALEKQKIEIKNECISIEKLLKKDSPIVSLWLSISEMGFNFSQAKSIIKSLQNQSGKVYLSGEYKLIVDRKYIYIKKNKSKEKSSISIAEKGKYKIGKRILKIKTVKKNEIKFNSKNNIVFVDADKLIFPLELGYKEEADWFIPFGMKGKKKLSDFFIDQKIPLHQKSEILVLKSKNNVVWICGHRLDDRFKLTEKTKNIYKLELK